MSISDLIQSMADAGAPMDAILIAVRAIEAKDQEQADKRRKAAERKQRERDRKRDSHATVTGQSQAKKEIPPTPPKEKKNIISITREAEFSETFWPAYPRKVSKPGALKAFRKARDKASLSEIMAGLERYQSQKPDYADWRHPATWLNDEGWSDDYGPPVQGKPRGHSPPNRAAEREQATNDSFAIVERELAEASERGDISSVFAPRKYQS